MAQTIPPVPPVPDSDRYYAIQGANTFGLDVPFPIYGDVSDLTVKLAGAVLPLTSWSLVSKSGIALSNLPQPITDGRILFFPVIGGGLIEVIGSIHPRQLSMATAPGIGRREFNQMIGYLLSTLRETIRVANLAGPSQGLVPNATGTLAQRTLYDYAAPPFLFLQTDDSQGRPVIYAKNSATAGDWSAAIIAQGPTGPEGPQGSIGTNPYLNSLDAGTILGNLTGSAQAPTENTLAAIANALNADLGFPQSMTGTLQGFPACTVAPPNYVIAGGQLISRAGANANLWAWVQANATVLSEAAWVSQPGCYSVGDGSTTFRLPQFLGEFQRFFDNGRGVDSGRVIGSFQNHQLQDHQHQVWVTSNPNSTYRNQANGNAPSADATNHEYTTTSPSTGNHGSETRPRNNVVLPCIHL